MVRIKTVAFVLAILLLAAMTATPANNAEQVIFSTPGSSMTLSGNTKATETPFGFWIWCAAEASANSKGGYQNANACAGSMYFYALDQNAKGIIGQVSEDPNNEGSYTMGVAQGSFPSILKGTFDPSKSDFLCFLTNPPNTTHTVAVQCQFSPALGGGTGSATVTNAVVNVTGP